jgi:hypothetical protein
MKKYTILGVLWLCFATIQAQQIIEKHLDFSGKEAVTLDIQIADSIIVHTWNKNEVFARASININENKDNEAYVTSFKESGREVIVKAHFKENYFKGKNNCCTEEEIFWEVYIPENTRFSVETINADVTISGRTKEMKVKSISGFIDLAVPETKQADINFSTISGRMYSNHKLALKSGQSGIPAKIVEELNSGGDLIRLETISGDIYFRKSN